jgi:rRNA maturation endonuclease Nob1
MNEKAKAELTRQLSEGLHFFVRCLGCGARFAGELPITACAHCDGENLIRDLEEAQLHYRALIEHALEYGES